MAKTEQTRARILDAALALFNEHGTAAVSTNHVAAAAGLSPGNLYYHYADKQEIILALHQRGAAAQEALWGPDGGPRASLAQLEEGLARSIRLTWEYRFLDRELVALLRADERLRADYRAAYERRLAQWVALGEQLAESGVLRRPAPPVTISDLATAAWLIGTNWLPFLEVTGDPQDPAQVARAAGLVRAILAPYLESSGTTPEEEGL